MGEKFNAPDPGAGQSTTTDEAGQRYMKLDNIRGERVGAPTDDPGAGQAKTTDPYWKMDHEKVADFQGEASGMAINEKGLPRHKSTK